MKPEEFHEEIIVSLGGSLMDVELTEKETELAFRKAKRTFQQKGSNNQRRTFFRLKVDKCKQEYVIPSNIDTIVKVIKPKTGFSVEDPLALATYQDLFYDVGNYGAGGFDFISYEFTLYKVEQFHRYMAYETQFQHDKHRNTIRFLKNPERDNIFWMLDCYVNLTDEEFRDVLWIQEWALAESMEMIGRAYAKFSGIPGPDGSTVSLGGEQLIQDAQRKKEQLLEDILNGLDGDPSYYEIVMG